MKTRLRISRNGAALYEAVCDVSDADSFGRAWAEVWRKLEGRQIAEEPSIGALMEDLGSNVLDENVLAELNGAQISLERA